MAPQLLTDVETPTEIDISHLVIEDDKPVDNLQSARQQRFFVQTLYDSDAIAQPFLAETNVGLFYNLKEDPIVPDVMLSLGVQHAEDYSQKKNRSYFVWEMGKLPEVCIEIVSNREGDEVNISRKSQRKGKTVSKKDRYARIGIQYYIVFDPLDQIQSDMGYSKVKVWTRSVDSDYPETLAQSINNIGEFIWLDQVEIGLTLWHGEFEESISRVWLRWCDINGNVILTGSERAKIADRQAKLADDRARIADRRVEIADRRAEQEKTLAQNERIRAEEEQTRAESAEAKSQRLADRLRSMGINPDEM